MEKLKKILGSPLFTAALFVMAAGLLLFSSVGGARAALTYISDYYVSQYQLYDIGVSLIENGTRVSWRDYASAGDGTWDENIGVLLEHMLSAGESFQIGKEYKEELKAANIGSIDQYVRVSVYTYWTDENGNKRSDLDPSLIHLHLVNTDSDWIVDTSSTTPERTVLYYSKLLPSGEETSLFADLVSVDDSVAAQSSQTSVTENGLTTITTTYDYDGAVMNVKAVVDAVQDHNAESAVLSAWGSNVIVSDGTLSLQ